MERGKIAFSTLLFCFMSSFNPADCDKSKEIMNSKRNAMKIALLND